MRWISIVSFCVVLGVGSASAFETRAFAADTSARNNRGLIKTPCEKALSADDQDHEIGISVLWIEALQKRKTRSAALRRIQQSIQHLGFEGVALNQDIIKAHNQNYTHELSTGLVTDQMQSGRCWIYSPLNVLRDDLITTLGLPDKFELSQTYLYFFSLLEKSNAQLEGVINNVDNAVEVEVDDGGYFDWFLFLANKYGIVTKSAMPDSASSLDPKMLLREINDHLGRYSLKLAQLAENLSKRGISTANIAKQLRAEKKKQLTHMYEVLATHLGNPPSSFKFREGNNKTYKPKNFAQEVLHFNSDDWVVVANYPEKPEDIAFVGKGTHIAGEDTPGIKFLNVSVERMAALAAASLASGTRVDIAVDIDGPIHFETGIMHPHLYDTSALYRSHPGVDVPPTLTRIQRLQTGIGGANHAMTLVGFDMPRPNGNIIKFKVETSWGEEIADGGFFHLYMPYFLEHVYRIAIPKRFLTPEELKSWNRPRTISKSDELLKLKLMWGQKP